MAENVQKQSQLMGVIGQNQAAYKQAFGYYEWRAACEVSSVVCALKDAVTIQRASVDSKFGHQNAFDNHIAGFLH